MEEKWQDVELGGRKFRFHKLKAKQAHVVVKLSNMLRKHAPESEGADGVANSIYDVFGEMSEKDYDYFQDAALGVCYELLPGNKMPVSLLNDNGTFGVEGLEDDTATVFQLMVMALLFNLESFLSGNPSMDLRGGNSDSAQSS